MKVGDYEVRKLTSKECTVVRYTGTSQEVTVPSDFNNLKPVRLGPSFLPKRNKVRAITLPPSVEEIDPEAFRDWKQLERLEAESKGLRAKDGILYDGSFRSLLFYPPMKEGREYIAPGTLRSIASTAFLAGTRLRSLVLPGSMEDLCFKASDAPSLEDVYIEPGRHLKAEDGVVYKGKILVFCPAGKKARHLRLREDCVRIEAELPPALRSLSVPSSLKEGLENVSGGLEELDVDKGNPCYSALDSVLYSTDGRLLTYPRLKGDSFFLVPGWVRRVEDGAFRGARVRTLVLSEGVKETGQEMIAGSAVETLVLPSTISHMDIRSLYGAGSLKQLWLTKGGYAEMYLSAMMAPFEMRFIAENPCHHL